MVDEPCVTPADGGNIGVVLALYDVFAQRQPYLICPADVPDV